VIFIISFCYVLLRYVVFGSVSVAQIPVYLTNKSISLSAVIFLLIAAQRFKSNNRESGASWGKAALSTSLLHILLSLSIFSESYYDKLFSEAKLTWQGEMMILSGVMAIFLFIQSKRDTISEYRCRIFCLLASAAIGSHLFFMGYSGWFTPDTWYGGMPPVSLVSFLVCVLAVVHYLFPAKETIQQDKNNSIDLHDFNQR